MDKHTDTLIKKRGPKPIGNSPMTAAERQRRRREKLRTVGMKAFSIELEGLHLEHVEALAMAQGISTAAALHSILICALDRYVGVMRREQRMLENGVHEEVRVKFLQDHLFPELPSMDDQPPPIGDEK